MSLAASVRAKKERRERRECDETVMPSAPGSYVGRRVEPVPNRAEAVPRLVCGDAYQVPVKPVVAIGGGSKSAGEVATGRPVGKKAWRAAMSRAKISKLKGLKPNAGGQAVSGAMVDRVAHAYYRFANPQTSIAYPAQKVLAESAGVSVRSVVVAQDWLIENGWLQVTRSAVPTKRGVTVVLTVPDAPEGVREVPTFLPDLTSIHRMVERPDGHRSRLIRPSMAAFSCMREDHPPRPWC